MLSTGSLPNMEIDDENIVDGKRSRSRTTRYVHPDEGMVNKGVYMDEEIDMAAEEAGEEFVPINADCIDNGEEESDGESDKGLPSIASEDELDTPSGSYVPSDLSEEDATESVSSGEDECD